MIESIIKILNKLKDGIKKYNVVCDYYKDPDPCNFCNSIWTAFGTISEIRYTKDGIGYFISIKDDYVVFSNSNGIRLSFKYTDEISKLELLKLAAIINQYCKEDLSNQMKTFADSFDDNEID